MKRYLKKIYSRLLFMDITVCGDKAWFCNVYFSALFEVNLNNFKIKMLSFLPAENSDKFNSYSAIAYYEGKLIIAPRNETRVIIYDIIKDSIEKEIKIETEFWENQKDIYNLFSRVLVIDKFAYLIPGRYPRIVRIDLQNFSLYYMDNWFIEYKDLIKNKNSVISTNAKCIGTDIYIPFWQNDILLKLNSATGKYCEVFRGKSDCGISDFVYQNGQIWKANKENTTISLCLERNDEENINIFFEDFKHEKGIKFLCKAGNDFLIFPIKGNMILCVDSITGKIVARRECSWDALDCQNSVKYVDNAFICAKEISDERVVACSLFEGKIMLYNSETKLWSDGELVLPPMYENEVEEFVRKIYIWNDLVYECEAQLEDWMEYILEKN